MKRIWAGLKTILSPFFGELAMKKYLSLTLLFVVVFFSIAGAEEFPLAMKPFKEKGDEDLLPSVKLNTAPKPGPLLKEPKYASKNPLFFTIDLGKAEKNKITIAIDEKKKGEGFNCLYIDQNIDQDLSNDRPLVGQKRLSKPFKKFEFPPCSLAIEAGEDKVSYLVQLELSEASVESQALLVFTPMCCLTGKVRFGEDEYNLVVFDSDCNGVFGDISTAGSSPAGDKVWIGKQALSLSKILEIYSEAAPHSKYTPVEGKYYSLNIKNLTADITPLEVQTGTLQNISPGFRFQLLKGDEVLSISSEGKEAPLPVGTYRFHQCSFAARDKKNALWTLEGKPLEREKTFEIKEGEITAVEIGPPLSLAVLAEKGTVPETYSLSFKIYGTSGEEYTAFLRDGKRVNPPEFKVFPKGGKNLVKKGKFEYG